MEPTTTDPSVVEPGAETSAQPAAPAEPESAATQPNEPIINEEQPEEPSADDNSKWFESKGIDPNSPEAVSKLAEMYRNAEKQMHQSTAQASELRKALDSGDTAGQSLDPESFDMDNPVVAQLVEEINTMKSYQANQALTSTVKDFFASNPDAQQYEATMANMVTEDENLGALVKGGYLSMDKLYAMAKGSDASRETDLKQAGGKEALERVASKQQARAVQPGATTSATAPALTKANVDSWYAGLSPSERSDPANQQKLATLLS